MASKNKNEGNQAKMRFLLLPTAGPMDVDVYLCGRTKCDHCPTLHCPSNNCQTQSCSTECITQCQTRGSCSGDCGTLGVCLTKTLS